MECHCKRYCDNDQTLLPADTLVDFQKLNQQISKASNLISESGVPKFYISIIAKLAQVVEETTKDKDKVLAMRLMHVRRTDSHAQSGQEDEQDECEVFECHEAEHQEEQCSGRMECRLLQSVVLTTPCSVV